MNRLAVVLMLIVSSPAVAQTRVAQPSSPIVPATRADLITAFNTQDKLFVQYKDVQEKLKPFQPQLDAYTQEVASYTKLVTAHNDWNTDEAKRAEDCRNAMAVLSKRGKDDDAHYADYLARSNDWTVRRKQFDAQPVCQYPVGNPSICDSFNASGKELDRERRALITEGNQFDDEQNSFNVDRAKLITQKEDLQKEEVRINTDKAKLDGIKAKLDKDKAAYEELVAPVVTDFNNASAANWAKFGTTITQRKAAGVPVDECITALRAMIPAEKSGEARLICGKLFD
jgi:peptidoglycan hydrolase CwlO-like protein